MNASNNEGAPSNPTTEPAVVSEPRASVSMQEGRAPNWEPPTTIRKLLQSRQSLYSAEERAKAFESSAKTVQAYNDEMIKRWDSEIETYLVYAGLFSAILTAFNVQSYQLLQPSSDPTLDVLQQISKQLSSFSNNPPFLNSTDPPFQRNQSTPPPDVTASSILLNTLWFSSLVLSLASASTCIMVKQWMNEHTDGVSSSVTPEIAHLRQRRLNSLIKWRVGSIMLFIPILLQAALALYLAGLLVLLWSLHSTVAGFTSAFVGALALFTIGTTILPLFVPSCAYLSPQTLALDRVIQRFLYCLSIVRYGICKTILLFPGPRELADQQPADVARRRMGFGAPLLRLLSTYGGRERPWISRSRLWHERHSPSSMTNYERVRVDTLTMAYDITGDPALVSGVTICFNEVSIPEAFKGFKELCATHLRTYNAGAPDRVSKELPWVGRLASLDLSMHSLLCLLSSDAGLSRDDGESRRVITDNIVSLYSLWTVSDAASPGDLGSLRGRWFLSLISCLVWEEARPLAVSGPITTTVQLKWMRDILLNLCRSTCSVDRKTIVFVFRAVKKQWMNSLRDPHNLASSSAILLQCAVMLLRGSSDTDVLPEEDRQELAGSIRDITGALPACVRTLTTRVVEGRIDQEELAALVGVLEVLSADFMDPLLSGFLGRQSQIRQARDSAATMILLITQQHQLQHSHEQVANLGKRLFSEVWMSDVLVFITPVLDCIVAKLSVKAEPSPAEASTSGSGGAIHSVSVQYAEPARDAEPGRLVGWYNWITG
ncbi:hypothetical protein C8Q77DRAFT_1162188 [Trametes polyzona]|nr:hypothetical protein C8Q77DRAFT_1162188 [Trametes polyzona]